MRQGRGGLGLVTGRRLELAAIRTVQYRFSPDETPLTIVRHRSEGANRFGQDAGEFPFCVINIAAWRQSQFDLGVARWFRTCEEILADASGSAPALPEPEPEGSCWKARFSNGTEVELRVVGSHRWKMWVSNGGRSTRRKDFATPFLAHARATAEHWYSPPIDGWHAPEGDGR